jgi:hypothetical protein
LLARARQHLARIGIRRNLEESRGIRCKRRKSSPAGISATKYCVSGDKQKFLRPQPKPCSCEKILWKTQKKKSSGILAGTVFFVQK